MLRRPPVLLALGLTALALCSTTAAQEPTPEQTPPVAPALDVPEGLASPRATIRTFLQGMAKAAEGDRTGLAGAATCLDLRGVNETVRAKKGQELALQLKQVIDRVRFVVLEDVPDATTGDPYVFHRDAQGRGDVVVARQPDGRWLFTRETLDALPDLVRALEHLATVEGATKVPFHLAPSLWLREHVPASLKKTGLLLEHWQWVGLLVVVLLGVIADRLLAGVLVLFSRVWLRRREVAVDEAVLARSVRPFGLLAMAVTWRLGDALLALPVAPHNVIVVAVNFLAAVAGVWGAYRLVDLAAASLAQRAARTDTKFDDLLVPLLRKTAKVFIAAMGLVFVAETMELSITGLLAGVGLGGLAFALAAQDTVKNLFGSLTVVVDRPFQVGDWVVIDGGVEGTVEEVGFRSTRVRTFYDSLVTLPNALLLTSKVDNLGSRRYRRWKTMVSITYDTPPDTIEAFCEGIRELIRNHPFTRKDYFQVWMNAFAGSSLDVLLYVFHEVPDWSTELRERQRLLLDIVRLANTMGVQFAFPTQTLHVQQLAPAASAGTITAGPSTSEDDLLARGRAHAQALLGPGDAARVRPPTARLSVSPQADRGDGGE